MTWYKEFGYNYNPFCIKPLDDYELFFDGKSLVDDIIGAINNGENLVLKGPLGTGKTSILKKIIDEFGGERKLYYYNAFSTSTPLNFEKVLKRAGNIFSRTFGIKSKNVVLFIDEAHHLTPENVAELEDYLGDYFKSVIIASSENKYEAPDEIKEHFKNTINLQNFTESDALNIIKDRLGEEEYNEIIEDTEIKTIYKHSKTPRDFLHKCESICKEKHEA